MDTLKAVARYNAQIRTTAAARYESLSSGRPLYTSFRAVARYTKTVVKRPPAIESSRSGRPLQKTLLEAVARYRHDEKRSTATKHKQRER